MGNPNQPTSQTAQDPIELEMIAIHELAAHPIILETQLAMIGALMLVNTVESLTEET